jgi:hypothetical protein
MSKTHCELLAVCEVFRAKRLTGEVSLVIRRYQYSDQGKDLRKAVLISCKERKSTPEEEEKLHSPREGNIGALSFEAISALNSRRSAETPLHTGGR